MESLSSRGAELELICCVSGRNCRFEWLRGKKQFVAKALPRGHLEGFLFEVDFYFAIFFTEDIYAGVQHDVNIVRLIKDGMYAAKR